MTRSVQQRFAEAQNNADRASLSDWKLPSQEASITGLASQTFGTMVGVT